MYRIDVVLTTVVGECTAGDEPAGRNLIGCWVFFR